MYSSKITTCRDCEREVGPHRVRCARCVPVAIDRLLDQRNTMLSVDGPRVVDVMLVAAYSNHR